MLVVIFHSWEPDLISLAKACEKLCSYALSKGKGKHLYTILYLRLMTVSLCAPVLLCISQGFCVVVVTQ